MNNSFQGALEHTIAKSIWNDYEDNHDFHRFGQLTENNEYSKSIKKLIGCAKSLELQTKGSQLIIDESTLAPYIKPLSKFFQLLSDESSRSLLVNIVAFRILGQTKIKLPLNTSEYWQSIEDLRKCMLDPLDFIQAEFMGLRLNRFTLETRGIPVEMYFTLKGMYTEFILRQYEYHQGNVNISIKPGDTVIDAGGCWGDTALLFAYLVGNTGSVHSFEFVPSNLEILERNIALNPQLQKQIKLVNKPLWATSGTPMYFSGNGPGASIGFNNVHGCSEMIETISIDDYVQQNKIEKVDFIKMDIEGAEPHALKGALETIQRFKPKLAIAIYHSLDDFTGVADLINSMELGYKLYLGHFTIHAEETILYAVQEA